MKRTAVLLTVMLAMAGSAQAEITDGLQAYLNFDNNIDVIAGGRTATAFKGLSDAATLDTSVVPRYTTDGKFGQAADFRNSSSAGVDDWAVTMGSMNSPWYWNWESWSFNLWVKSPTATTHADRSFFGWQDYTVGSNTGVSTTWYYNRTVSIGTTHGWTGQPVRGTIDMMTTVGDGDWHMITVIGSFEDDTIYGYLDGELAGTSGFGGAVEHLGLGSSGYSTLIGASGRGRYGATSHIDDVGMWSRKLTEAEIAELYAGPLMIVGPVPPAGDLDHDFDVDADDIDLMGEYILTGLVPAGAAEGADFDLTADGLVEGSDSIIDVLDMDYLVHSLVDTAMGDGTGTEYGDFNLDGVIDTTDLTRLATNFGGGPDWADGNANPHLSTTIDTTDLTILSTNFGFNAGADVIPEPATLSMLALGGLAVIRRRRK